MELALPTITIEVDNLSTGASSFGTNTLNAINGNTLRVTGVVSPDPNLAAGDLEVEIIPTGPNPPFSPTTLGVLKGGSYLGGSFPIYPDTRNFSIQAKYLPTGDLSPIVNVVTGLGTSPPPTVYEAIVIFLGNAQTMTGIPGGQVVISDQSGNPYGTLVANSSGYVTTSIPLGSYALNGAASGFNSNAENIQVAIGIPNSYQLLLTPSTTTPPPPPPPPPTYSYNCVNGNCVQVSGSGGQFATLAECQANCGSGTSPPTTNYLEIGVILLGVVIIIAALALW